MKRLNPYFETLLFWDKYPKSRHTHEAMEAFSGSWTWESLIVGHVLSGLKSQVNLIVTGEERA